MDRLSVADVAPAPSGWPAPSSGAVALTAAASLASGLPFLIVRNEEKEYGTARRVEGVYSAGEEVCLVEDVVRAGAAAGAVEALRSEGLECTTAVCVVDREEGGADALARQSVRLVPLFGPRRSSRPEKRPANPHGCVLSVLPLGLVAFRGFRAIRETGKERA